MTDKEAEEMRMRKRIGALMLALALLIGLTTGTQAQQPPGGPAAGAGAANAVGQLAWQVNPLGNITGATSVNLSQGNVITGTLTGNVTFTFTNGTAGQHLIFILTQDATGGRTVTWPAGAAFGSGTAATVRPEASATDTFGFDSTSATAWQYTEGGDNPTFTNITTRTNAIGNAAATQNLDFGLGGNQTLTLTQNTTLTFSNIPPAGTLVVVQFTQNGTGGFTVTWPATAKFLTSTAPTVNQNANGVDTFSFLSNGTNLFQYGETYHAVRGLVTSVPNAQGSQASAVACNLALSNICTWTATGNVTVTVTSPVSGSTYTFVQTQDATGGRTTTFSGLTLKMPGNQAIGTLAFNQQASAVSAVTCVYDGTNCHVIAPSQSAERYFGVSAALGGLTSTAGATLLQTCEVATQSGHFVDMVCVNDLNGGACTTAPTYNVRDDTAATTGTAAACGTAAGQVTTAESISFSAGDRICLVRTVNGGTCTAPIFSVNAHIVTP